MEAIKIEHVGKSFTNTSKCHHVTLDKINFKNKTSCKGLQNNYYVNINKREDLLIIDHQKIYHEAQIINGIQILTSDI